MKKNCRLLMIAAIIALFAGGCLSSAGNFKMPEMVFYQQVKKIAVLPAENAVSLINDDDMNEIANMTSSKIFEKVKNSGKFEAIDPETCQVLKKQVLKDMRITSFRDPVSGKIDTSLKRAFIKEYKDRLKADYLLFSTYIVKVENMRNSRVIWDGVSQSIWSDTKGAYKGSTWVVSLSMAIKDKRDSILWQGIGGVGLFDQTRNKYMSSPILVEEIFKLKDKSLDRIQRAVDIALNSIIKNEN